MRAVGSRADKSNGYQMGDTREMLSGGNVGLGGKRYCSHHFQTMGGKRTTGGDLNQRVTRGGGGGMKPLFIACYRAVTLRVRGKCLPSDRDGDDQMVEV